MIVTIRTFTQEGKLEAVSLELPERFLGLDIEVEGGHKFSLSDESRATPRSGLYGLAVSSGGANRIVITPVGASRVVLFELK